MEPIRAPQPEASMSRDPKDSVTRLHAHDMANIEPQVSMVALVGGCLVFPLTFAMSWWVLNPREEAVVINCGKLDSHVAEPGCHFHNCVGREIRMLSTAQISYDLTNQRVTDSIGNPVIISAVITYRYTDATKALLNTQNPNSYVVAQGAAALKTVMGKYTYDELKIEADEVTARLKEYLQPRVEVAGATILSVGLNELNYAPEIAQAMLKKQAAAALVEARNLIVKGALGIATTAVASLEEQGLKMDDRQKFDLVKNLLIVTVGDKDATPTLTVG